MIILLLASLTCIVVILVFSLSFAAETLDAEIKISELVRENNFLRLQLEDKQEDAQQKEIVFLKEKNKEWFV